MTDGSQHARRWAFAATLALAAAACTEFHRPASAEDAGGGHDASTGGRTAGGADSGTAADTGDGGSGGAAPMGGAPAGDGAAAPDDGGESEPPPLSNGCAGGACLNPACAPLGEPAAPGRFVELGFEPQPAYIPSDVVIPTFDDAPDDAGWTRQILDWLDAHHLHADFFMNSAYRCDVAAHPECGDLVARILTTQNPGNHTAHHIHMGEDSGCRAAEVGTMLACEDELSGVESLVQILSDGAIPHLTRFRAPYGQPFQAGGANLDEIKDVVARFAVHVGWAVDAGDADHDSDGQGLGAGFFVEGVARALGPTPGQGRWGVIRMHATYAWSPGELAGLFDPQTGYVPTHHFRVGTVEDAICWKYGRHSWELLSQITGHRFKPN